MTSRNYELESGMGVCHVFEEVMEVMDNTISLGSISRKVVLCNLPA
jgi:hypothetical protein